MKDDPQAPGADRGGVQGVGKARGMRKRKRRIKSGGNDTLKGGHRTNKGGRPPVVTLAKVEEIGEHMANGMPEHYACLLCGVNPETFPSAVSRKPEFRRALDIHHARFMQESLHFIKAGGERVSLITGQDKEGGNIVTEKILPWTGRAWILERRYKPHFNRTDVVKVPGPEDRGGLMTAQEMADLEKVSKALEQELEESRDVTKGAR